MGAMNSCANRFAWRSDFVWPYPCGYGAEPRLSPAAFSSPNRPQLCAPRATRIFVHVSGYPATIEIRGQNTLNERYFRNHKISKSSAASTYRHVRVELL